MPVNFFRLASVLSISKRVLIICARPSDSIFTISRAFSAAFSCAVEYRSQATTSPVITAESPNVSVAIRACAAPVEIPKATASRALAAVSRFFIFTTVTRRKAESLFRVLNTCWSPIVMAITLWTRVCILARFSFSEAKSDSAPVAVVNSPARPLTPDMKPWRFASSFERIFVWVFRSASVSERSAACCAIFRYSSVSCFPSRRMRAMLSWSSRSCMERRLLLARVFSCSAWSPTRAPFSSSSAFFAAFSSSRAATFAFPGAAPW